MKSVLHITSANSNSGAGKGVLNLHHSLLKIGIRSKILFLKDSKVDQITTFSYSVNLRNRIAQKFFTFLDKLPTRFYFRKKDQIFSCGLFGIDINSLKLVKESDVIHFHWINHGFISINSISKFNKPIVWTLRDMWAFTGGCHQSFECMKFKSVCGSCIVLSSKFNDDLSTLVFSHKYQFYDLLNVKWVAISSWIKERAAESTLLKGNDISIIYSGINTEIFNTQDIYESRLYFSLPQNQKIILVGAQDINESYKGIQYSIYAINKIKENICVVTFGNSTIPQRSLNKKIYHLGFIKNEYTMSKIYTAADLFLSTSIAEAFGKTVAEAQACGLPVVCFDSTGPAEIIEHKKTGFIAKFQSAESVEFGINYVLKSNMDRNFIRKRAVDKFNIDVCALQYLEIYKKL